MERVIERMAGRPKGSTNVFPSDTQRQRLYNAEREVSTFHQLDFESLSEVNRFVQRFIKRKAWTTKTPVRKVEVVSYNRVWATGSHIVETLETWGRLDLPKWGWNKMVIAHELAHVMTPPIANVRAIHNFEFAGTYLYLVNKICGKDVEDELIKAFFRNDVDWKRVYV